MPATDIHVIGSFSSPRRRHVELDRYGARCYKGKRRICATDNTRKIDRSLNLIGKVCPYPTLDTRSTLQEMAPGEILEVVTDYYPARQTIPELMNELGYPCELRDGLQPVFRFIIRKP